MQAYQHRVVDEKRELDERLGRLFTFMQKDPAFYELPNAEQDRLTRQSMAMAQYSMILGERIAAFKV